MPSVNVYEPFSIALTVLEDPCPLDPRPHVCSKDGQDSWDNQTHNLAEDVPFPHRVHGVIVGRHRSQNAFLRETEPDALA